MKIRCKKYKLILNLNKEDLNIELSMNCNNIYIIKMLSLKKWHCIY